MSNQIEFRHYRYFLAVAEDLHFRKAAERLFISQPGLSRQIKQMEDELGVKLFTRHNRKVELTAAGSYLQQELKNNFRQLDDLIHHAKLLNDGIKGHLNLGFVGSAMQKVIPDILLKLKQTHPNILFSLNEMDNKQQIEALLNKEIDVGFVRVERVPGELQIRALEEDTFSLVLPENHPINETTFKSLAQLKDESFILFNPAYSESYYEKIMQIFDDSGFTPTTSHSTVDASSIYRLVENDFGISIVPTSLKHGFDLKIKFIELEDIPQRTTLRMVWNPKCSNPILKSFLQYSEKEYVESAKND
ncbi:LysR family transcriptional regulator [Puteibacter caeruleilacunae]|nr:LysR family transcriptional regulator [Puteibacter caeruleilacunae]